MDIKHGFVHASILFIAATAWSDPPAPAELSVELKEARGPVALRLAERLSAAAVERLTADPAYLRVKNEVEAVLGSNGRLPAPQLLGDKIYNLWRDAQNPKGIWRRTSIDSYQIAAPEWEVLLDLDALGKKEGKNWLLRGFKCLRPGFNRCLVELSEGGGDAVEIREFDLEKKRFLTADENGFVLPMAKSFTVWVDESHILAGTNFGPGTLTKAGYPRTMRLWRRGASLSEAKPIFEGKETGWIEVLVEQGPDGNDIYLFVQKSSRYELEFSVAMGGVDQPRLPVPVPANAEFLAFREGQITLKLRTDWKFSNRAYPYGSVISIPVPARTESAHHQVPEVVYAPDGKSAVSSVTPVKGGFYISILKSGQSRLLFCKRESKAWALDEIPLPEEQTVSILAADPASSTVYLSTEGFLTPPTLVQLDHANGKFEQKIIHRTKDYFDVAGLTVEYLEAASADGTKIPYFLVRRKDIPFDGTTPLILHGYGGFERIMAPTYSGSLGKAWLERGGAYALALIRGGGEFGPEWHKAALGKNRQKSYDDFLAVARDLIRTGVTSPRRLGIMGRSNGGLLTANAFVQGKDLFSAAVSESPLIDMLNYHTLLAGSLWVGEYGNPEEPANRPYLAAISPHLQVKPGENYCEMFLLTSTDDDRVHPYHARVMAMELQRAGHPVLFFENGSGGHAIAVDHAALAQVEAMKYIYFMRKLGLK